MEDSGVKYILPLIVSDGLTKEVFLGLHYPVKRIRELGRKSGLFFVALYLKQASTTCLMQYYSTTGKYKPYSLSVSISLTRSGLSRIISPYHRNMISKRDDRADVLVRLFVTHRTNGSRAIRDCFLIGPTGHFTSLEDREEVVLQHCCHFLARQGRL